MRNYSVAMVASALLFVASGLLFAFGVRSLRELLKPVDFYAD